MDQDTQPWQYRLANITTPPLTPSQMQMRDPLWKLDDDAIYSSDKSTVVRCRSYDDSDGQTSRQEVIMAAGENAGVIVMGNDAVPDRSVVLSYADVVVQTGQYVLFDTSGVNNLLWNSTPFNPRFNPYFQMPASIRTIQDAFAFGQGTLPGVNSLQDLLNSLGLQGASMSPFDVYAMMTPQKVPLGNEFFYLALQMLLPFANSSIVSTTLGAPIPHVVPPLCPALISTFPGSPVAYSPEFIAMATLALLDYDTMYGPSLAPSDLGEQLKQLAAVTIPGVGGIAGLF